MTALSGLFIAFTVLTLVVVAGLFVLLRQRCAVGRSAVPERAGENLAVSSTSGEES